MAEPAWVYNLFRWQTLIGSLITAFVAFATILVVRSQVLQDKQHEQERLKRKALRARSALPSILGSLSRHVRNTSQAISEIYDDEAGTITRARLLQFSPPPLSDYLIDKIHLAIEDIGEMSVVEMLYTISIELQILESRVKDVQGFVAKEKEKETWDDSLGYVVAIIRQAALIDERVSRLLAYARNKIANVDQKITEADAGRILTFFSQSYVSSNILMRRI
ncbi:hypothetical protein [Falsiroseomonas selenitidurans]|uniref:Uncharacterized protein n=1 Tax=Falsiroseomonas selenitidurans TaxID=2716335 RepID=A0ABX1E9T2_9PROT|nr:hypothetical protein [Falsiroseomonas selenitidurans]NKC33946.1 hypothetical protein [Falsiroseomonas selenitidurans]